MKEDEDPNHLWVFKDITGHQDPLKPDDKSYKGSKWNVMVNWEDGSMTYEPLRIMGVDTPEICAKYAKDNNLLELDGWKQFKRIVNCQNKLLRIINQVKLRSFHHAPIYKFGMQVARNLKEAVAIDKKNGNQKFQNAIKLELKQLHEHETFKDIGKGSKPPPDFSYCGVHFVLTSSMICTTTLGLLLMATKLQLLSKVCTPV